MRNRRGKAPKAVVHPLHAHSTNEVAVRQFPKQSGQIGGVILKITIQGKDHDAPARPESGPQRRALARALGMAKSPDPRVCPTDFQNPVPGIVRAAVIHQNQLQATDFILERAEDLPRQGHDIRAFVVKRHDYGDFRVHMVSQDQSSRMLIESSVKPDPGRFRFGVPPLASAKLPTSAAGQSPVPARWRPAQPGTGFLGPRTAKGVCRRDSIWTAALQRRLNVEKAPMNRRSPKSGGSSAGSWSVQWPSQIVLE